MILARRSLESLDEIVDGELNRRVADGMETHLPSHLMGLLDSHTQFFFREGQRSAKTRLAPIGIDRVGTRTGKPTVDEHLDGPDAQAFVTVASLLAEGVHPFWPAPTDLHVGARELLAMLGVDHLPFLVTAGRNTRLGEACDAKFE